MTYKKKCRHDIQKLKFNCHTKFSNLSSEEWLALKNLSKRHDIVIKSADKGGAVVVWRSDLYKEEALRQFSDTSFLPKIHKPNNPGRPIVSACSCPTELISSYLDKIMAPIVKSLPSYIKDSQHALEIFRDFNFLGQDKLIFTMDISSLYTVIPNSEGLLALKYFFDQRTVKEPSSETLLRLAELVLTLNCFSFAGNYYKQINGVAMGTKMGPSYANLFVGYVEHQFFNQYDGPKPGACFSKVPRLFGRISGDIILFVSSKRWRLEAQNFAVIFIFIPFTTY